MNELFPGSRPVHTFMVETEALYRKARWGSKTTSSDNWTWKKRFFPAQMYLAEILDKNLGATDNQIEQYYKANKQTYADTIKIPVATTADTSDTAPDSLKDTLVYKPLVEVRSTIAETLFLSSFPPDSAFWASQVDSADTAVDTASIHRQWIYSVRRQLADFFMNHYYEKRFGEPLPDSLDEWVGEGKVITPDDLEVIRGWLPEQSRERYDNPGGKRFLAGWLLKWKLFSDKATESGFTNDDKVEAVLEWAKKYEVVSDYVTETLASSAPTDVSIDTAMAVFACWDNGATPGVEPDSAMLSATIERYQTDERKIALEKAIQEIRDDVGVEFLQSDWKDSKDQQPERIAAEADSLLEAGESDKALTRYRDLTQYFPFTEEGRRAFADLAKVQTEKGNYRQAIQNYRRYLITTADNAEERCNTLFMIGFIYDEYLNKAPLAEVQYKWILENARDCELADDAEFMVLHLDEPMTTVEDLRAEARRQGRTIEDEEPLEVDEETAEAVAEELPAS
jgi:tetratricopeptide (TPR) repeat protein